MKHMGDVMDLEVPKLLFNERAISAHDGFTDSIDFSQPRIRFQKNCVRREIRIHSKKYISCFLDFVGKELIRLYWGSILGGHRWIGAVTLWKHDVEPNCSCTFRSQ